MSFTHISVSQLKAQLDSHAPLVLLDVREPHEFNHAHIEGSVLIPLNQLPQRLGELDKNQAIAVLCHHGMRSQQAANFLVHNGFIQVANVQGGIDAWSRECDSSVRRY